MSEEFEVTSELVGKIEEVLGRGLCKGAGDPLRRMCVEAAVCFAMGLPHGDNPPCVGEYVRSFKIALNDATWSSALDRAAGMRRIAIAQLGSNQINQGEFSQRMREKTIRILIPTLIREVFKDDEACLRAANICEAQESCERAIRRASVLLDEVVGTGELWGARRSFAERHAAIYVCDALEFAAFLGSSASAAIYATAASIGAASTEGEAAVNDKYLVLSAELCFQVLDEMDSPGAVWMRENNWQ